MCGSCAMIDTLSTFGVKNSELARKLLSATLCDHEPPPGSSVHGISQQEYWTGLPFSPPGDLPDPGSQPKSPALADSFFTTSATWEAIYKTEKAKQQMKPCSGFLYIRE